MARTKKRYLSGTSEEVSQQSYRAGIYIRLSKERTEEWRNKSQSLVTQESLARTFAKEKGLTVVKSYTDYEYSGTKFNRPAFQEMIEDIKTGLINCILIRDLSRLGRDYIEMGRLIDKVFPFLGVRFISINDNLDTINGLEGKKSFEVEIKNLVNDLYAKDISRKVNAYNIGQATKGYYIGTKAPYGYRIVKNKYGSRLVVDQKVKPVLEMIFKMALEGYTTLKIVEKLNQEKFATPQSYKESGQLYKDTDDTKVWKAGNLLRLLNNPTYQGNLVQRKSNSTLSDEDLIRFNNAHEGYISQNDYEIIKNQLTSRRNVRKSKQPRTPNRYKGLIFAKGNKTKMRRYCRHFSNTKSDYDYYYFMDYINDNNDSTSKKTVYISEIALDKLLMEIIHSELTRLGAVNNLLSVLSEKKDECIRNYRHQITRRQQQILRLKSEISELYAQYSLTRKSRSDFQLKKSERLSQIDTISQEIALCETLIKEVEEEYKKQMTWVESIDKCREQSVLTTELLRAIIKRIEVTQNKEVIVTFVCQIGGVSHD